MVDMTACETQTEYDKFREDAFPDYASRGRALALAWSHVEDCMNTHGWVPDGRKYWIDTTEKNRPELQNDLDDIDCEEQSGEFATGAAALADGNRESMREKSTACMALRGWKPADDKN
jgi:hypothetical protein